MHGPRSNLVLVKRSCGQVPTIKDLHTRGSVIERLDVGEEVV